jgi:hypothetical protein
MSVAQAIVGTVYMAIDYWALASVLGGVLPFILVRVWLFCTSYKSNIN